MKLTDGDRQPWALVTGVHGSPGVSGWKQLVPGYTLRGPWEAVELARLPPGGVSGRHRHTRTSEIYFSLAGQGEYLHGGMSAPLVPGYLAVTPLGGTHGLLNTGTSDVMWLVAEVPALFSSPRTNPCSPAEGLLNSDLGPVNLNEIGQLDLSRLGVAPLREVGVDQLSADETRELTTERGELFCYLLAGSAVVVADENSFPISQGTALTLTRGESARLTAAEPSRLFWLSCAYPDARQ
jgi:mannose-6-phosphate isomerase-like protein (cupin superfamily)